MYFTDSFNIGLGAMPLITNAKTRSISAENPCGKRGEGGKEASNLGPGRKGRPAIILEQGKEYVLAEIEGTGIIQHIWFTLPSKTGKTGCVYKDIVLRFFWDGEEQPSIEVPIGDFFCNGFGVHTNVNSLPVAVNPVGGMNCYIPMPFRKSVRITVENQHPVEVPGFFYQVNYSLVDSIPDNAGYLHASWKRSKCSVIGQDHVILDNVKGKGQYVGTYICWSSLGRAWWGEGEIKFYIDGDEQWPTICGTGTEDYFGGAWCFANLDTGLPESYSTPFLGYRYFEEGTKIDPWYGHKIPMHGLYRWHIMDPVRFETDIRVTIQQIGHNGVHLFERADDVSSVAYWYQTEPHVSFPVLPDPEERWPR